MRLFRVHLCTAALAIALAAALAIGPQAVGADQAATGYLAGIDDLPLMAGFEEVAGSAMNFDTPGGRIMEVQALGAADRDRVAEFYTTALPQLGWLALAVSRNGLRFERDEEILVIEIGKREGGVSLVQFRIAPRPADPQAK